MCRRLHNSFGPICSNGRPTIGDRFMLNFWPIRIITHISKIDLALKIKVRKGMHDGIPRFPSSCSWRLSLPVYQDFSPWIVLLRYCTATNNCLWFGSRRCDDDCDRKRKDLRVSVKDKISSKCVCVRLRACVCAGVCVNDKIRYPPSVCVCMQLLL